MRVILFIGLVTGIMELHTSRTVSGCTVKTKISCEGSASGDWLGADTVGDHEATGIIGHRSPLRWQAEARLGAGLGVHMLLQRLDGVIRHVLDLIPFS